MGIKLNSVYVPSEKVVARKIEDELIIIPIQEGFADLNDAMFSLNETGQAVWEKLVSSNTVLSIIRMLTEEFDASFEQIEKDVLILLEQLYQKQLIIDAAAGTSD